MGKIFPQITTLKDKPSSFEATIRLIEKSFHYSAGKSFKDDFAPLVDESNHHNCYILIDENDQILAHVGVKERIVHLNGGPFNICLLGGIAVDENHRGQGNFQKLFIDVLAEKRSEVCFFLLWSDQEKLYTKHGFSLCGGQYEIKSPNNTSDLLKTKFHLLTPDQRDTIKALYQNSFLDTYVSVSRNERDWDLLAKVHSADLYFEEKNGVINSYLFANKGEDLSGIVYEYGTRGELSQWLQKAASVGKVWMGAPLADTETSFYQFMLCPGDTSLFGQFISTYTNGVIKIRDINVMKQEVFFDFGGETLVLPTEEFLRGVFGPAPFEELGEIKTFFLSGLDSV